MKEEDNQTDMQKIEEQEIVALDQFDSANIEKEDVLLGQFSEMKAKTKSVSESNKFNR